VESSQLAADAPHAPLLVALQLPFWQLIPPQQSPSCEQIPLEHPQVPSTHSPEQHTVGSEQPVPSCWHEPPAPGDSGPPSAAAPPAAPGTHPPFSHAIPLQQSELDPHVPPFWLQPQ
jgi:hypothetical protein